MIVRVLRGHVHPGHLSTFREQAENTLLDARRQDGMIYAQLGRQSHADGGEDVVFVSIWCNMTCLYRWIGGTDLLGTPVLGGGNPNVFEHFEVQHYESYEPSEEDLAELAESQPDAFAYQAGA